MNSHGAQSVGAWDFGREGTLGRNIPDYFVDRPGGWGGGLDEVTEPEYVYTQIQMEGMPKVSLCKCD